MAKDNQMILDFMEMKLQSGKNIVQLRQHEIYCRAAMEFTVAFLLSKINERLNIDLRNSTALTNIQTIEQLFYALKSKDPTQTFGYSDFIEMFGDANLLRKHTNEYALSRANNETLVRNYRSPVEQEYFQKILELSTRPDGTLNPEIFTVLVEPPDHKSVDKLADVFEEASSKNPYLFMDIRKGF